MTAQKRPITKKSIRDVDASGKPIETTLNNGEFYSLKQILSIISSELPGVRRFQYSPLASILSDEAVPFNVSWRFDRPDREYERLTEKHDLHAVLQPDGETIKIFARGEGLAHFSRLSIDERYADVREWPHIHLAPDAVLVAGAARQREVRMTLIAFDLVGLPLDSDELQPLDVALSTYGLSVNEAGSWVLQKPEKQVKIIQRRLSGTFADPGFAASRLRSWLFRWYRIPKNVGYRLPILDLIDPDTGVTRSPIIHHDTFDEVEFTEGISSPTGAPTETISRGDLQGLIDESVDGGAGAGEGASAADIASALSGGGGPTTASPTKRNFFNVFSRVANDADVNLDRRGGVLKFSTEYPPGFLLDASVDVLEQTSIVPSAVTIDYRIELKGYDDGSEVNPYAPRPSDHFLYAVKRSGASFTEVPPESLDVIPRVIRAPELVVLERFDGTSNEDQAKRRAKTLVSRHFTQPQTEQGFSVNAAGIWPVWPDGAVGLVQFRMSEREVSTQVVGNSYRRVVGSALSYSQKKLRDRIVSAVSPKDDPIQASRSIVGPNAGEGTP